MVTRLISIIILSFATLVLTGCGGTLVLGGKPVYATNKVDLGGSESSSSQKGPGYKSQTSQWDNRLGYNLGTGKDRVYCLYDQGHSNSTNKDSRGKTVYQSSTHRRDCRPDPEPVGSAGSFPIHPSQGMVSPRTQSLSLSGPVPGQPCEQNLHYEGGWIKNGTRSCTRTYVQGNSTCTVSKTQVFRHFNLVADDESPPNCRPTPIR